MNPQCVQITQKFAYIVSKSRQSSISPANLPIPSLSWTSLPALFFTQLPTQHINYSIESTTQSINYLAEQTATQRSINFNYLNNENKVFAFVKLIA